VVGRQTLCSGIRESIADFAQPFRSKAGNNTKP
jgi:hypothetical protein